MIACGDVVNTGSSNFFSFCLNLPMWIFCAYTLSARTHGHINGTRRGVAHASAHDTCCVFNEL